MRPSPGFIFPHTPLTWCLAGDQTILQSLGCGLNGGGGILQSKCTIGTDLVLMSLHAIDHAALSGRDVAAILPDLSLIHI